MSTIICCGPSVKNPMNELFIKEPVCTCLAALHKNQLYRGMVSELTLLNTFRQSTNGLVFNFVFLAFKG